MHGGSRETQTALGLGDVVKLLGAACLVIAKRGFETSKKRVLFSATDAGTSPVNMAHLYNAGRVTAFRPNPGKDRSIPNRSVRMLPESDNVRTRLRHRHRDLNR